MTHFDHGTSSSKGQAVPVYTNMIAPLVSAKKTFESRRADDDEAKVVGLRINERKMKIRAQTDDE